MKIIKININELKMNKRNINLVPEKVLETKIQMYNSKENYTDKIDFSTIEKPEDIKTSEVIEALADLYIEEDYTFGVNEYELKIEYFFSPKWRVIRENLC